MITACIPNGLRCVTARALGKGRCVRSLARGRVRMSKVKVTRDKKHTVHSYHPRGPPQQQWNGTCLLQVTSCSSRQDHSVAVQGWFRQPACSLFGETYLALVVLFLNHIAVMCTYAAYCCRLSSVVCVSQSWVVQKWLNRSIRCQLGWGQEPLLDWI